MQARFEKLAPGFGSRILERRILGPAELESRDANLIGGAINGGTSQLHQELVFRPVPGLGRAETGVPGLYLGGASAHPGGGVHGAAGMNAARAALAHSRWRRADGSPRMTVYVAWTPDLPGGRTCPAPGASCKVAAPGRPARRERRHPLPGLPRAEVGPRRGGTALRRAGRRDPQAARPRARHAVLAARPDPAAVSARSRPAFAGPKPVR